MQGSINKQFISFQNYLAAYLGSIRKELKAYSCFKYLCGQHNTVTGKCRSQATS